ncbi:MAG: KH domain-containing protein [Candidatus Woesearchaeota archaeon]
MTEEVEYHYELKIAKDRIAVLIGKGGETKRRLEKLTGTKIDVSSQEGDVMLSGKDPIGLYSAKEIVTAIGRGFNPDVAKQLVKQDYGFEIINLGELATTKDQLNRLRGRVIGEGGKGRKTIERLTDSNIAVYGKTIGIIGRVEMLPLARRAIESLLAGSKHATVYKWLEKRGKELKIRSYER